MAKVPEQVAKFLSGSRFAVAGVSRQPGQAANGVFRKLRDSGYEVFPVNPNASETEGAKCYPDLGSIPAAIDRVVVVTHPSVSAALIRQCVDRRVGQVWFHRSFGQGSVSDDAIQDPRYSGPVRGARSLSRHRRCPASANRSARVSRTLGCENGCIERSDWHVEGTVEARNALEALMCRQTDRTLGDLGSRDRSWWPFRYPIGLARRRVQCCAFLNVRIGPVAGPEDLLGGAASWNRILQVISQTDGPFCCEYSQTQLGLRFTPDGAAYARAARPRSLGRCASTRLD